MIQVKRVAAPPAVLEALLKPYPKYGNRTEIERARDYYAHVPPPTKAYAFERYSEFAVRSALDALFHDKCAYCESPYKAVDARNVEHFRPKGRVQEDPDHPGYWWLAAEWTNLFPSCPPCNQRRRQVLYEEGLTLEEIEERSRRESEVSTGKANAFPVRGSSRARRETDPLTGEDPLLLDPCERDPSRHITYVFDWKRPAYIWEAETVLPVVKPRMKDGKEDPYGHASIAIYGLRRAGLFREQVEHLQVLQRECVGIVETLMDLAAVAIPAHEEVLTKRLDARRTALLIHADVRRRYAALSRAFIAEFERELKRWEDDAT